MDGKTRIGWVDTAKGIGLLLVIIGHLPIPLVPVWIYTFHMPLFFFLSGVVFSGKKYTFIEFLKKKVKSLVIPYFSLGLVIYLFYVIVNGVVGEENGLYGSNSEMFVQLLKQEHFWTIWFLACLFLVEIIYYWINYLFADKKVIISVIICGIGLGLYHFGCDGLPWNLDIALIAQFFYHMGYAFKNHKRIYNKMLSKKALKKSIVIAGIFLIINVLAGLLSLKTSGELLDMSVGLYGNELLTIISAISGVFFVIIVSNNVSSKILNYLGKNTMIIFAWHSRIIIVLFDYIFKWFGILQEPNILYKIMQSIIVFICIFLILIPINELIKRSRIHNWFGV